MVIATPTQRENLSTAYGAAATWVSVHPSDPGSTGTPEASGGVPAYIRKATVWAPGVVDGVNVGSTVSIDVPAGTYTHIGLWTLQSGGVFRDATPIPGGVNALSQTRLQVTPTVTVDPSTGLGLSALGTSPLGIGTAVGGVTAQFTGTGLLTAVASQNTGSGRVYPLHTLIYSTTFWVGELFNPVAADGSQVCSTYDSIWAKRWSGKDNGSVAAAGTACVGAPLGGCDGVPSGSGAAFACATEARSAANNYFPTDPSVSPLENPFYLDLPFDDVNDATAYGTRGTVIPWANDPGFAGQAINTGFSYMKNRWVKLMKGAYTCYAQIEDAGPGEYHDATYVFGAGDSRPVSTQFNNAGMDVSPAVNGALHYAELDGQNDQVSWQFVDAVDVPLGPWTQVVTYSQVQGANGGIAYNAAIRPPGAA